MSKGKITQQSVEAIEADERDIFIWDQDLAGFGLKVTPTDRRVYLVQFRTPGGRSGRTRRVTIGPHGSTWTADLARTEAKRILAESRLGADPAKAETHYRSGAGSDNGTIDRTADRALDGTALAELVQVAAGALATIGSANRPAAVRDRMAVLNEVQRHIAAPEPVDKWEIIRIAGEPNAPGHARACGMVMAAAFLAGEKWFPPQETIQRWLKLCGTFELPTQP